MKNMKKLAICAVALCAVTPLFAGMWWTDHQPSQKAQKKLVDQMLSYLNQEKAKDMEKVFAAIPDCNSLKKTYKENQLPTVCRTSFDPLEPYTIETESVLDPGHYKPGVPVATVDPIGAFRSAATKYFALKKNSKYMDYNKMQKFYENYRYTWAGRQLKEWATYQYESYAMTAFVLKAVLPNIVPEKNDIWPDRFLETVARQMHDWGKMRMPQWWEEATKVYNDKATFYQVKWNLFSAMMLYDFSGNPTLKMDWLMSTKFWKNFAITPISPNANVPAKEARKIRDAVKSVYKDCKAWDKQRKENARFTHSPKPLDLDCGKILLNAKNYGYYGNSAKVATQKTKQKLQQTKKK